MKKRRLATLLVALLTTVVVFGQDSYIVKTNNKNVIRLQGDGLQRAMTDDAANNFVVSNFKFHSLCDWEPGMKFMVIPDKYDLVINTFVNNTTNKEETNVSLMHHIMEYRGHSVMPDGRHRIDFFCTTNNTDYYYLVPSGTFDAYCDNTLGIPTLAYLGDVDIAKEKLMGMTLYAKTTKFRVDTDLNSDGYENVNVEKGTPLKVVSVGVGTRSFPVKIVLEDVNGKQFYQNVAISRTNSGLRQAELMRIYNRNTFQGAFRMVDSLDVVTVQLNKMVDKEVYTRYRTTMRNSRNELVKIARLSTFKIRGVRPNYATGYVRLTLFSTKTAETFVKDVTLDKTSSTGIADGYHNDYYSNIFVEGNPWTDNNVPQAHRTYILQGKVMRGFTEEEVKLALGEPQQIIDVNSSTRDWVYGVDKVVRISNKRVVEVKSY
ncbi:MAG: hypothetical protein PUE03_05345 [Prevotella sp.]|nr:hypothetical protein [Prevotella sp.]MCI5855574.1 hypothetical protein [Prevotella sp.]MDD6737595.1 hypothetical protein [Prevotella sp.]